jgi:peptidoglycan/LPS O-acetylase OafA/YrhL
MLGLALLAPRLGYPLALVVTFVAVVAISALSYRIAELPSQRLARRLTSRQAEPGGAPKASVS